jgi:HPt (histidine-containing phosphotransfer) domain-containing protein
MADSPIDKDALFELVDEDPEFLGSLVDTFLRDCTAYMDDIRTAVEEDDAEALRREAHGLKGASGNMQAEATEVAARRLEDIGRSGDLEQAPEALRELEEEVDRLIPALEALVEEV